MKYLFSSLLILVIAVSCNKNNKPDTDEVDIVSVELYGTWAEVDQYLEYKLSMQENELDTISNIIYHFYEDSTYRVDNDCDYGIPIGEGRWQYNNDFKVITFIPDISVHQDTSIHLYWQIDSIDESSLKIDYYQTTRWFLEEGLIDANKIPRHFIKH